MSNDIINEGTHERLGCSFCGSEVTYGQLCDKCKDLKPWNAETWICENCGNRFEEWKRGPHWMRRLCKNCLSRKPKPVDKPSFTLPPNAPQFDPVEALKKRLGDNMVLLDFSKAPWVLKWLKDEWLENPTDDLEETIIVELAGKVRPEWAYDWLIGQLCGETA